MPAMYGLRPLFTGKSWDNVGRNKARLGDAARGVPVGGVNVDGALVTAGGWFCSD